MPADDQKMGAFPPVTGSAANDKNAETNAVETLLPSTLAGVFDEAFDLYKRHFAAFAMTIAAIVIPLQIVLQIVESVWLRPMALRLNAQGGAADLSLAFFTYLGYFLTGTPRTDSPGILTLAALAVASGAITLLVADIYSGKQPSVRTTLRGVRPYVLSLIGGWTLAGVVFLAAAAIAFTVLSILFTLVVMATASLLGQVSETVTTIGALGMILSTYAFAAAVLAYYFVFTTPLIVLERAPASQVSARNIQLAGKNRFWRTWGAVTFLPLVTLGLMMLILWSTELMLERLQLPPLINFMTDLALSTAILLFFQPYWMVFLTLLYYDYRIRREGFDVRLLSANFPGVEVGAWGPQPAYGFGPPDYPRPPSPPLTDDAGPSPTAAGVSFPGPFTPPVGTPSDGPPGVLWTPPAPPAGGPDTGLPANSPSDTSEAEKL